MHFTRGNLVIQFTTKTTSNTHATLKKYLHVNDGSFMSKALQKIHDTLQEIFQDAKRFCMKFLHKVKSDY